LTMLSVESVSKSFGGLMAVCDITLDLGSTPVTGLVGPNGSGKTTLFHMITGLYPLDKGRIRFRDKEITGRPAYEISRMGLVRTFQQTRVLPFLSTRENLLSAVPDQKGERLTSLFLSPGAVKREEKQNRARADEVLRMIRLLPLSDELAGRLSYGQQKLLELGRVLMAEPKMILLDEPTAGINPTLIRQLVEIVKELTAKGVQVFLIEHNMPLVAEICDHVFVLDSGSLIFSGSPGDAVKDRGVIEAYLGRAEHAF
jgi:ABC-type branched-subunit amino acid transport system ATPase component